MNIILLASNQTTSNTPSTTNNVLFPSPMPDSPVKSSWNIISVIKVTETQKVCFILGMIFCFLIFILCIMQLFSTIMELAEKKHIDDYTNPGVEISSSSPTLQETQKCYKAVSIFSIFISIGLLITNICTLSTSDSKTVGVQARENGHVELILK